MAEEPPKQTSSSAEQSFSTSSLKSSDDAVTKVPQITSTYGSSSADSNNHMHQTMYQPLLSGFYYLQQNQEELNRGPGLYAVSVNPFMDHMTGFPPNTLIPLRYSVPTERSSSEHRAGSDEQGQGGQQPQLQQHAPEPQRQVVVRRFQIAFQRDLFLILKLAAVIFLFNQDGSKQRLVVLVFFASLIYLYQTGALAPLIRWLSQGMQRGAAPPQRPRPAVRAENAALAGRQGNQNGAAEAGAEGNVGENGNQPGNDGNRAGENEHGADAGVVAEEGNRLWLIVKEIQMIVFGFITSLLPGFHNID
ncbi:uncharacterized protein LOC116018800 isoform X1 [Ipomoea triloba]|uniref:uncharacterized protein LOC116018800 isoform X1 n=1 Tax=Ipomoea triloba TaxID=35885 RepID=UPI00125D7FB6|nr:uncharacterized protein LOC116018800 isoform X1 [Ipomoea triloba]